MITTGRQMKNDLVDKQDQQRFVREIVWFPSYLGLSLFLMGGVRCWNSGASAISHWLSNRVGDLASDSIWSTSARVRKPSFCIHRTVLRMGCYLVGSREFWVILVAVVGDTSLYFSLQLHTVPGGGRLFSWNQTLLSVTW